MRESRARYGTRPITDGERVRVNARNLVRMRIKRGRLQRGRCVNCGTPNAHAHHDDYTKPLDITWLCSFCHRRVHRDKAGIIRPVTRSTMLAEQH